MARLLVPLKDLNQELWAMQMDQQEQEGKPHGVAFLYQVHPCRIKQK